MRDRNASPLALDLLGDGDRVVDGNDLVGRYPLATA
jgi:hypothetical protein